LVPLHWPLRHSQHLADPIWIAPHIHGETVHVLAEPQLVTPEHCGRMPGDDGLNGLGPGAGDGDGALQQALHASPEIHWPIPSSSWH